MRHFARALLVLICSLKLSSNASAANPASGFGGEPPVYKLILTPQRLRRLQRDRERQTVRWANFESRVQTVADSPERGFELALYYAVTHDRSRGREAIDWGLAHACDRRQIALILDWCGPLASPPERERLASANCRSLATPPGATQDWKAIRDRIYLAIATQKSNLDLPADGFQADFAKFAQAGFRDPKALYALCELIDALRINGAGDIRRESPQFFMRLPAEYLLSMKPAELAQPNWEAPIAALALVAIDPNLQDSQFLQGWAIEDRQMVQDGPGVAYELLWGNPYLPGVSFQNLDPWYYGDDGRLIARTDWTPDACWIDIEPGAKRTQTNCAPDWFDKAETYGRLQLIPLTSQCTQTPSVPNGNTVIVWTHKPGQKMITHVGERQMMRAADSSGLLQVPHEASGKICLATH
ncbi:MAG TPA: hypothetical protein VH325_01945 [Bryobacteraceae bacterium]|nr:hypothetical protein [Bryobacteraceae bacterium]